jgi:hypothetical protein
MPARRPLRPGGGGSTCAERRKAALVITAATRPRKKVATAPMANTSIMFCSACLERETLVAARTASHDARRIAPVNACFDGRIGCEVPSFLVH